MIVYAYTSTNKQYEKDIDDTRVNINRVFLSTHRSTITKQIIANVNVVIEPKTASENFRIHVDEEVYNVFTQGETVDPSGNVDVESLIPGISAIFYNEYIGFQNTWTQCASGRYQNRNYRCY